MAEQAIFTVLVMVSDGSGNLLMEDRNDPGWPGICFPGGHVEKNEIFNDSVIREVWEETGLKIENPKLRGVYHWHRNGIHNVLFLYKAEKFSGELKSSEEGKVYWIPLEELKKRELATGMEYVLEIMESDQVNECYMKRETQGYVGTLY